MEEQQSQASSAPSKPHPQLTPAQKAQQRKKQGLELSRQRVRQQLQAAQQPAHREMLQRALTELDQQIAGLP